MCLAELGVKYLANARKVLVMVVKVRFLSNSAAKIEQSLARIKMLMDTCGI